MGKVGYQDCLFHPDRHLDSRETYSSQRACQRARWSTRRATGGLREPGADSSSARTAGGPHGLGRWPGVVAPGGPSANRQNICPSSSKTKTQGRSPQIANRAARRGPQRLRGGVALRTSLKNIKQQMLWKTRNGIIITLASAPTAKMHNRHVLWHIWGFGA
jgi:hypothetical protein